MSSEAKAKARTIVRNRIERLDEAEELLDPVELARIVYPESRSGQRGPRRPDRRHIDLMSAFLLDWAQHVPAGIECEEVEAYDRVILRVRRVRS